MALGVRPVWAASSVAVRLTCVEYSSEMTSSRAAWAKARMALGSVISTLLPGLRLLGSRGLRGIRAAPDVVHSPDHSSQPGRAVK